MLYTFTSEQTSVTEPQCNMQTDYDEERRKSTKTSFLMEQNSLQKKGWGEGRAEKESREYVELGPYSWSQCKSSFWINQGKASCFLTNKGASTAHGCHFTHSYLWFTHTHLFFLLWRVKVKKNSLVHDRKQKWKSFFLICLPLLRA